MKRTVRVAILGVMLQGSAHAGEPNAAVKPAVDKGQGKSGIAQPAVVSSKKNKVARKKVQAAEAVKSESPAAQAATEKPATTTEQSIQLKGVRG
jgi:hypothetical protein